MPTGPAKKPASCSLSSEARTLPALSITSTLSAPGMKHPDRHIVAAAVGPKDGEGVVVAPGDDAGRCHAGRGASLDLLPGAVSRLCSSQPRSPSFQQIEHPEERYRQPARPVRTLIADLIDGFL